MEAAYAASLAGYLETPEKLKSLEPFAKSERADQLAYEKRVIRRLKASQQAFVAFRESACAAVGEVFDGGSIQSTEVQWCRAKLTEARAKFLKQYFSDPGK